MNYQNNIHGKVVFVENEKAWQKFEKKTEAKWVIIKHDGKNDFLINNTEDKSKLYLLMGGVVSIVIIISYILTNSIPEIFPGGAILFSTFYQFAIAYLISLLFYYITVIIPLTSRHQKSRQVINYRIAQIVHDMRSVYSEIQNAEQVEFKRINFGATTNVLDANAAISGGKKYLLLGDYIRLATKRIRDNCKELLVFFYTDLTIDTAVVINETMNAFINSEEFTNLTTQFEGIDVLGEDILEEYQSVIRKLEEYR